jgi:hypothetical protein
LDSPGRGGEHHSNVLVGNWVWERRHHTLSLTRASRQPAAFSIEVYSCHSRSTHTWGGSESKHKDIASKKPDAKEAGQSHLDPLTRHPVCQEPPRPLGTASRTTRQLLNLRGRRLCRGPHFHIALGLTLLQALKRARQRRDMGAGALGSPMFLLGLFSNPVPFSPAPPPNPWVPRHSVVRLASTVLSGTASTCPLSS